MEWSTSELYEEIERLLCADGIPYTAIQAYTKPGKCVRPLLIQYCGALCNAKPEQLFQLALAVELLHIASLIHDDIIDQSVSRRGFPSVHSRLTTQDAVLLGDWAFGVMMEVLANLPRPARYNLARIVQHLVRGEWKQKERRDLVLMDESMYFEHIYDKTAYFIATCCKMAAELGSEESYYADSLTAYGYYLGMAYQIRDDLLDYVGTPSGIGKPTLQDWSNQTATLPFIHHFTERAKTGEPLPSWKEIRIEYSNQCVDKLEETNSFRYTMFNLTTFIQKAVTSLDALPENEIVQRLQQFALELVIPHSFRQHMGVHIQ